MEKEQVAFEFRPTLILTPVNSIHQAFTEIKKESPSLKPYVFFSTQSAFPDKQAKILTKSALQLPLDRCAKRKNDPATARVVILSTYPTWPKRILRKKESLFTWKEGFGPNAKAKAKAKKNQKDGNDEESDEPGSDSDDDVPDPEDQDYLSTKW